MTIRTGFELALFACLPVQASLTVRLSGQAIQQTQPRDSNPKSPAAKPTPSPNPNEQGIYHVGDGVPAPKLIYSVEAEFSEQARKRKIGYASVTIHFIVDTDGHVRDVKVVKSAADGLPKENARDAKKDREADLSLDQQALKAASQYRFEPARYQGRPVPVEMNIEITFQVF